MGDIQQTFKNWLEQYFPASSVEGSEPSLPVVNERPSNLSPNIIDNEDHINNVANVNKEAELYPGLIKNPLLENGSIKVFENEALIIYVQKAVHQRQKNFRFQDTLFHIKIDQKDTHERLFCKIY